MIEKTASATLGFFAFLLYAFTAFPGVPPADGGEFVLVAKELGVAHPTGYPLYTLLTHILSNLFAFVDSWAYQVNLVSAVYAGLTSSVLFLIMAKWIQRFDIAAFMAIAFSLSPLVWEYAGQAEVYSLHNLMISLVLLAWLGLQENSNPLRVLAFGLLCGLALSNHHTGLFFVAPAMAYALWSTSVQTMLWALPGLVLGLSVYFYLPIADALLATPVVWGHTSSLQGFFDHVLRREYGTLQLTGASPESNAQFFTGLWIYFKYLSIHTLALVPALLIHLATRFKNLNSSHKKFASLLAVCFFTYLFVFSFLANKDYSDPSSIEVIEVFWPSLHLPLFLLAGLGLNLLLKKPSLKRFDTKALWVGVALTMLALSFIPQWNRLQLRSEKLNEKWHQIILDSIPQDSLVLLQGDQLTNVLRYKQRAEKKRGDLDIVPIPLLHAEWYQRIQQKFQPSLELPGSYFRPGQPHGYNLRRLFEANQETYANIIASGFATDKILNDKSWVSEYRMWPFGLLYKVVNKKNDFDLAKHLQQSQAILKSLPVKELQSFESETWVQSLLDQYFEAQFQQARALVFYGYQEDRDRRALRMAFEILKNLKDQKVPFSSESENLWMQLNRIL